MKKRSLLISSLVLLLFLNLPSLAQTLQNQPSSDYNPKASYDGPYKMNTWSVSIHGGPSMFFGDLREYDFWPVRKNGPNSRKESGVYQGGLTIHKQLSYLFGTRLDGSFGNLRGMKRRQYNRYFNADYQDVSLAGTVNLKALLLGSHKLKHWKVDAYAGIGRTFYDASAYDLTTKVLLRETGKRNDWMVPLGMSINYEIAKRFDIGFDFRLNYVNSDYLDATYGGDYDRTPLSEKHSFKIKDQNSSRKGSSSIDSYGYASFMLTYKLGKKPLKVQRENRNWDYRPQDGYYNLRYTDPKVLDKGPRIMTLQEMDSVAKANRPEEIDPRLLTDSDGDGVSDYFDKEPNSPEGSVVDGSGRVIDFDKFVKTALTSGAACNELFANIEFDTNKSTLKPESKKMLIQVATMMNKNGCRLQISGHSDRTSSDRYNMELSRKRVEAVKNHLIKEAGLKDPSKITVEHYGPFKPIANSDTREGLQKNRRVELKLLPSSF
jgi:OOP family OmpA-OmpF porin